MPGLIRQHRRTGSGNTLGILTLWLSLGMGMNGCALSTGTDYVKACVVPADQTRAFEGKWTVAPIPIALKNGDFNAEETADIIQAARVWNSFFEATQGISILDYGSADSPNQSTASIPSYLCGTSIVQQGKFVGQVVIHKKPTWTSSNHNAIALTNFCASAGTPYRRMKTAMMEVNYQDFFVAGKKLPDLQSIFVHEFGHLIGLDHSCETKAKTGMPLCSAGDLSLDYFYAVMFPTILFDSTGLGEQRRELQSNDQGRANCLYETTTE